MNQKDKVNNNSNNSNFNIYYFNMRYQHCVQYLATAAEPMAFHFYSKGKGSQGLLYFHPVL